MYDVKNFGERLQILRKAKQMTQEELAHRTGITGQAVSKWETGQSFPDITLIPALAEILDTTVSHFFGEETPSPMSEDTKYPESYNDMALVLSSTHGACYSNKQVKSTDNTSVTFTDGSTAELTTRIVINKGQGNIRIIGPKDKKTIYSYDTTPTSKNFEYGHSHSLKLAVLDCNCKIIPSADEKTRIYAQGTKDFVDRLTVGYSADSGRLEIGYQQPHRNKYDNNNSNKGNTLEIEMPIKPDENGGILEIDINGNGNITCEIPVFDTGSFNISGSGTCTAKKFVTGCDTTINGSGIMSFGSSGIARTSINGSGSVNFGSSDELRVDINGSGSVVAGKTQIFSASVNGSGDMSLGAIGSEDKPGDCTIKISGSGVVGIGGGYCKKFDVEIGGS